MLQFKANWKVLLSLILKAAQGQYRSEHRTVPPAYHTQRTQADNCIADKSMAASHAEEDPVEALM